MPGISIHVVDVSRGVIAAGMRVELYSTGAGGAGTPIAKGEIGVGGTLERPELAATFSPGRYSAIFHVGAYYRATGVVLPDVAFLEDVQFEFGIADPNRHYHLPFKCTPWGYSCFRGGA
jgi:5-hydroxyisourate hydrolase